MVFLVCVALGITGSLAGLVGPRVIAALPEPDDAPEGKAPYRDIAHATHLIAWLSLAGLLLGAATGAGIGWNAAAWPWGYLIPLGVVLSYIDLRTRLLPTRLIAPSYAVMLGMVGVAAVVDGSTDLLIRALLGWAAVGGLYLVLWLISPRSVGYGDVRFSGLLGLGLGCVGWPAVVVGAWFGFFLGGMGGLVLRRFTGLKNNAHGPAMVVGAVIGVVAGAPLYHALYR